MRNVNKVGAAVVVALLLAVMALPVVAASQATVGQFVVELARAKSVNATDARIALDSLRAAGVNLPANLDLNRRLTEADVAEIARAVGVRVTTNQPDAAFTDEQVDRFFVSFAGEIAGADSGDEGLAPQGNGKGPPFDPSTKGKGKKKGHTTPTEPE
jgi:hypothetical protein